MKILLKLGGTLLDDPATRARLCKEIAWLSAKEHTAVVHGGGKQMTRFLEERGVNSEFVDGLRVSGPEVIDAVLKVFAGTVNHQLVASLVEAGALAVGLSGIDAALTEAEVLDPRLGAVGRIQKVNPAVLHVLVQGGFLPVVACVGGDRQGNVYNVNADLMAVALAKGFGATKLLFLTDVDGVRGADNQRIEVLRPSDCVRLIADGVATGGMQAKLSAASDAVHGGVSVVAIVPGASPGVLERLYKGESIGTKLVPEGGAHA